MKRRPVRRKTNTTKTNQERGMSKQQFPPSKELLKTLNQNFENYAKKGIIPKEPLQKKKGETKNEYEARMLLDSAENYMNNVFGDKLQIENVSKGATKGVAKSAGKGLLKNIGKRVPGVGVGVAVSDISERLARGDTKGAMVSAVSTAVSQVPVIGTAAGIAIDMAWEVYEDGKESESVIVNEQMADILREEGKEARELGQVMVMNEEMIQAMITAISIKADQEYRRQQEQEQREKQTIEQQKQAQQEKANSKKGVSKAAKIAGIVAGLGGVAVAMKNGDNVPESFVENAKNVYKNLKASMVEAGKIKDEPSKEELKRQGHPDLVGVNPFMPRDNDHIIQQQQAVKR